MKDFNIKDSDLSSLTVGDNLILEDGTILKVVEDDLHLVEATCYFCKAKYLKICTKVLCLQNSFHFEDIYPEIRTITWSVEDFISKAIDEKGESWENFYDKSKFAETLNDMIDNHDCNYGITWETVKDYLDKFCLRK